MKVEDIFSWVLIGIILLALGVTVFLGISAYENYAADLEIFRIIEDNTPIVNDQILDDYPSGIAFYPNLRFKTQDISYTIDLGCDENRQTDSRKAFNILQENTILRFKELSSGGDIEIACSEKVKEPNVEYFIAGEGGPNSIVNTTDFYIIGNGTVLLYRDNKCSQPVVALHEILHVLGFKHSINKNSIMYEISNCNQKLTNEIIQKINSLYSIPSLPDLSIQEVNAEKKGSYLNFDIEILNSGLDDSPETLLSIYANNKKISDYPIASLDAGSGRILKVTNLKVPRETETLVFYLDEKQVLFEINEYNNDVTLILK